MTRSIVVSKDPKITEDYDFQKVIGTGSFGKVYLVKSKHDGKHYAMKVLNKSNIVDK